MTRGEGTVSGGGAVPEASKPKNLVILGAGGHGKVLADLVQQTPGFRLLGLLDDDPAKLGTLVLGSPVLGPIQQLRSLSHSAQISTLAFGAGDNRIRSNWFDAAQEASLEAATLMHPSAVISRHVKLGFGVIVLAGVVVNAGAVVGDNVCLNTGCRIDHDCRLGKHSHVFPGATLTGGVELCPYATVGAGAVVHPNRKIGRNAYVGAGAVVTANVGDNEIVAGNPARLIRVLIPDAPLPHPSSKKVADQKV